MKNKEKLLFALFDLLSEGKDVNKHSLSKSSGVHRWQIERILKKHNEFIDVEVIDND